MKRLQAILTSVLMGAGFIVAAAAFTASPALAQEGSTELMSEIYRRPGEFFLFDSNDEKTMDFQTPRPFRICLREQQTLPMFGVRGAGMRWDQFPLVVTYDGITQTVPPGSCLQVTARHVSVKASDRLDNSGYDMVGTAGRLQHQYSGDVPFPTGVVPAEPSDIPSGE